MAFLRRRRLLELAALDHRWISDLAPLLRGRVKPHAQAQDWDQVYAEGEYDRLSRHEQRHHHRLLAALLAERAPHPAVLELGAGEGVFLDSLKPFGPRRYLGVDLSALAVERAQARFSDLPQAAFAAGDGRTWSSDGERFDAVVLSECFEYLGEPAELVARCRAMLAPGGVIGVTQWLGLQSVKDWRRFKDLTTVRDEVVITAAWGGAWVVAVLEP